MEFLTDFVTVCLYIWFGAMIARFIADSLR